MTGKVVVVTGASGGIGKQAALELGRRGAEVVLVCRNRDKGAAVLAAIEAAGGRGALVLADLARLADVRRAAAEVRERWARLDVLVNNAGVLLAERRLTADGYEETFAVNHLAAFLLTRELLPLLHESAPARVVLTASTGHWMGRIHWDDLMLARGYSEFKAYAQSKLANILCARELARRLRGTGVTANALHPGAVATRIFESGEPWFRALANLSRPFLLDDKAGAATTVYLATSPEVASVSGEYFARRRVALSAPWSRDMAAAARLWDVSEKLCCQA